MVCGADPKSSGSTLVGESSERAITAHASPSAQNIPNPRGFALHMLSVSPHSIVTIEEGFGSRGSEMTQMRTPKSVEFHGRGRRQFFDGPRAGIWLLAADPARARKEPRHQRDDDRREHDEPGGEPADRKL